jgi:hypothetical protein
MRLNLLFIVLTALLAGCATAPPPNLPHPTREFPADALITTRGVLTARGRQFPLNGYVSRSATGGQRLIVTENFGNVMADVLVKLDGTVRVMRAGSVLRPTWVERYMAGDLICIFGGGTEIDCPGQMLSPTHFIIERRWYKLDLQIVDIKPGPQSPGLFEEKPAGKP